MSCQYYADDPNIRCKDYDSFSATWPNFPATNPCCACQKGICIVNRTVTTQYINLPNTIKTRVIILHIYRFNYRSRHCCPKYNYASIRRTHYDRINRPRYDDICHSHVFLPCFRISKVTANLWLL